MPLTSQRDKFDIPDGCAYFNSASQSPCPRASYEAGQRALLRKYNPWTPDRDNLSAEMERCRELFGGLVGGKADDVAIVFSTSYGIATAAANLSLEAGKEILLLEGQFPSNALGWKRLAARSGGSVREVRRGEDFDWTGAVLEALDERIGIVALPNCHWSDGALVDLSIIGAACRKLEIPLVVDATQSVGAVPMDLESIPADFIVASGYKWLLSPDTMGFMYVAPKHQSGQPLELNQQVYTDAPASGIGGTLKPNARRFDMGAADSMIHMPMTVTALEQVTAWGPAAISEYLTGLVDDIADRAAERGFRFPPKARRIGHFIGLYRDAPWPEDLLPRLAARGVHSALRNNALRISPYLFNDSDDVAKLFAALDAELG